MFSGGISRGNSYRNKALTFKDFVCLCCCTDWCMHNSTAQPRHQWSSRERSQTVAFISLTGTMIGCAHSTPPGNHFTPSRAGHTNDTSSLPVGLYGASLIAIEPESQREVVGADNIQTAQYSVHLLDVGDAIYPIPRAYHSQIFTLWPQRQSRQTLNPLRLPLTLVRIT